MNVTDFLLLVPIIAMVVLLLIGFPIAFSLAISGILGILIVTGDLNTLMNLLGMVTFDTVANYTLTTVPMFILLAFWASSGGLAEDLFKAASNWFGHLRGGLAIGTFVAVGIFGAMSGVTMAAASVMTQVALPRMREAGYSDTMSAGVVGVGATTDCLIPPSVGLVIYGIMTETSIGKLLLAGIVPGILVLVLLSGLILIWATIRPQDAPTLPGVSWPERWRSLLHIWPSLFLILMILGLLYAGICTPTEVGGIGAFFACLFGILFGNLKWKAIIEAVRLTIQTTAMIFMILIGAFIFGYFMTLSGIPQKVMAFASELEVNRWFIMIGIVVCYFVISMFMDELPLMLITLQLTFPLVMALGFDPIWFGIMNMMMTMMGLVFPPVGLIAFVVSAVSKIELHRVFVGTSILMSGIIITTILICIFPEIVTWLPSTMR
ncbi:MAG: TRAP transporter large permease [Deltaproteobacteria bacterium]|nr:TRAP transporter large permease [Deltaproteobacteria bacterium]